MRESRKKAIYTVGGWLERDIINGFNEIQSCQRNVVGHGSISILDTYVVVVVEEEILELDIYIYIYRINGC